MTPLAVASRHGNTYGVGRLIRHGVNVDATGQTSLTALAYALQALNADDNELGLFSIVSRAQCIATIRTLLEAGANPNCALPKSFTPTVAVARFGYDITALTVVLDRCERKHPDKELRRVDASQLMRTLLSKGARPDGRGRAFLSP